ncbi:MAG: Flp pilus assembly complex ATPase component TadA [Candidatus Omnitrophica bacterium]|nr:Flp pilus assembly complex ATPase component TadA [Candidatus Omnitrophota bacterium]
MSVNARFQFISNILVEKGIISQDKVSAFQAKFESNFPVTQEELEDFIIQKGLVSESDLLIAYSKHLNIPIEDLSQIEIDPQYISLIPAKFANRNKVIVLKKQGLNLVVAMRNPFAIQVIDELKVLTNYKIIPTLAKTQAIESAIKTHYGVGAETVETLVQTSKESIQAEQVQINQISEAPEKMAENASIINYVNQILLEAYQKNATDIHIEPFDDKLRIRYRIDGVLQEAKTSPDIKQLQVFIVSRLKIMSGINIAERRRPQDGRCKIKLAGEDVDLRLSTFPTLFGEGVSIRLLSKKMLDFGINQLGFPQESMEKLKDILKKPNGIILVTGPTGCGKTTTLYSCLSYINDPKVNIITLEDPIEYQLQGINQIQINPQVDLTFATGLRSILRQDPDIIMVGEIRDIETAQISIRAALTGHLMFSTLHTNDALSSIIRLLDLGIEPYLVSGTVRAVIAQRLVRKICTNCKTVYIPEKSVLDAVGLNQSPLAGDTFYKGKGCAACSDTGFSGRIGIYELLIVDEQIGNCIVSGVSAKDLKAQAIRNKMISLKTDGMEKVKQGITTLEEVLRVTEQE